MRITSTTPEARFDFVAANGHVDEAERPFTERRQRAAERLYEWQERTGNGSFVPDEVDGLVASIARDRVGALRAHYDRHRSALAAEQRGRVERMRALRRELTLEAESYAEFERQLHRLAARCGQPAAAVSLVDEAISTQGLAAWESRVERVLNPPAVQPPQRRAPVALDLAGV